MVRLGVVGQMADEFASELRRRYPLVECVDASATEYEALLVWEQDVSAVVRAVETHPGLHWVHLRWAGVPDVVVRALQGRATVLTNGSGAHGVAVAEYVAGVVLAHYKGLFALREAQTRAEWLGGFRLRELRGAAVGVVGLGDLGGSIARTLRQGFGAHVRGLRRSGGASADVDEVFSPGRLTEFLDGLEVLVVAAPLTAETRGMIGAAELERLATGALLVNVGRGPVVDEVAMLAALRSGQLGGAALDVFGVEPLPRESELWSAPGVFISPHCCDATPRSRERGLEIVLENLGRYVRGEALENVVDRTLGY